MGKWPKITLKSNWGRLVLVAPSQEDDNEVATLRSDPTTMKYLLFLPNSTTAEQYRHKREENDKKDEVWNFHIHLTPESTSSIGASSSRFIGQCGIFNIDIANRHGEIGILLTSRLHRTGIATEALYVLLSHVFEHPDLKMHRVEFVTGIHNVQMRGWFNNFGVEVEHRLREAWSDGQGGWIDAVGYSILEDEWPDLKARLEKWLDARVGSPY